VYNSDVLRLSCAILCALALPAAAGVVPGLPGLYAPQNVALPMVDSKIDVAVRGPIVEATITQTFRNDTPHALEATYIFPLPNDAAVSAMAIDYGGRRIRANVERREQAQQRYEDAVAHGIGASMLEQERPDIFTQTVSAIASKSTVTITLRYDTTASYRDGTWELVLPLVVAPRYVPGVASGRPTTGSGRSPDTERSPDASRVTPHSAPGAGGKTAIAIAFQTAVDAVSSPTHDLAHPGTRYLIEDAHSDHDAIVRWHAKAPAEGWVESDNGAGFAAAVIAAPPAPATRTATARCMLVLDRAATTHGDGDVVEHAVVHALFGALEPKDRVAVTSGEFYAPEQVQRVVENNWQKGGAFDLTRVLAAVRPDGAPLVLLTDGLVSDDTAAIAAARKTGVPIHVVGFGAAPNRSLLVAIANATGGTVRFVVPGDDLAALAHDLVADVATPPQPLAVSWGTLAASDVVPATLPRIGAGQAALVLARVTHAQAANARARGDVFALAAMSATTPPVGAVTPTGALGRRWARLKLDDLVAAGNRRAITDHALAFGLVSPYTAMVAVGDEVVVEGGVKHTKPVPVSVPAGMHWQEVKHETAAETESTFEQDDKNAVKAKKPAGKKHDAKKNRDESGDTVENGRGDDEEAPKHTKRKSKDDDEDDKPAKKQKQRPAEGIAPDADGVDMGGAGGSRPIDRESIRNLPAPEPVAAREMGSSSYEDDADAGTTETVAGRRRAIRLALALGAGIAVERHTNTGIGAVSGRVEVGGRTLVGAEASLWFDGNLDVEGTVLATVARRGIARWLELGAGFGLHVGNGAGPAVDLVLRTHLPERHIGFYLRYDGALLVHDTTRDGQNTATFGLEADF
jgi:Ca-activated chloride channel family protein